MFATVEEAEKAAAMLRRFGGGSGTTERDTFGWKVDPGEREAYLHDWEQVADFLLARQDVPDDQHSTGLLGEASVHLQTAKMLIDWEHDTTERKTFLSLMACLGCILEALA